MDPVSNLNHTHCPQLELLQLFFDSISGYFEAGPSVITKLNIMEKDNTCRISVKPNSLVMSTVN